MLDVTDEYFPKGKDWVEYLERLAKHTGIINKIEFGAHVVRMADETRPCVILQDGTERCAKRRIFIGTGLQEKKQPLYEALGGIPYSQVTKEMAKRRRVCILGNGNSGFEVAQNLYKIADRVTIYGRHDARLSSVTRYTGDVRIKYLQILENLNMKLLDTVDSFSLIQSQLQGLEDILTEEEIKQVEEVHQVATWLRSHKCETFVITTGFQSNVPQGLSMEGRFPKTTDWYTSVDNPTVHYIGWLMHERDFRKSAGGFLSGFRYLIRNLAYHIREVDSNIANPAVQTGLDMDQVVQRAVARIQTADDLFILQDGVAVRDIIVPRKDIANTYDYYEGITHDFYPEIMSRPDIVSVYFGWGEDSRTSNAVFDSLIRYADTRRFVNVLLHPVIETQGKIRGVVEDIELSWVGTRGDAVARVVRKALYMELDGFHDKPESFPFYEQPVINQSKFDYYENAIGNKVNIHDPFQQALWKAVYTEGREQEMNDLELAARDYLPKLFDCEIRDDCETRVPPNAAVVVE